jgi:hypothetical protein
MRFHDCNGRFILGATRLEVLVMRVLNDGGLCECKTECLTENTLCGKV